MRFVKYSLVVIIFFSCVMVLPAGVVLGQTELKCGDIVEDEFQKFPEAKKFIVEMSAGDKIEITGEPIGDNLAFNISIWDKGGKLVGDSDQGNRSYLQVKKTPKAITSALSANGSYDVLLGNGEALVYAGRQSYGVAGYAANGGVGSFTLSIKCILRDGTVINPGDKPAGTGSSNGSTNAPAAPAFSGTGFPGLDPVDFANAFTNEITFGQPAKSKIPTSGDAVLGYTFDAAANDNLALDFTRVSGNLNLGIVVLSADNKVVFQASLVTSSELTTKFTLPSAGTYTIGIFRIDLLPPDAPEATSFQLTATLNP